MQVIFAIEKQVITCYDENTGAGGWRRRFRKALAEDGWRRQPAGG